VQTILFIDIDSTLVENHYSRRAIGELLGEIAVATGQKIEDLGHELWLENKRRQEEDPNNLLTMDWDDIVARLALKYTVTLSAKVDDLWVKYTHVDDIDVLDNAPEVLKQLKQPHRKLVIATKGLSKYQFPLLEAVNLKDVFDDLLTPDITGYLKTEAGYFNKYTQNGAESRFIQIGDHYYDDVICAKRNGFTSIMRAPIEELKPLDPFERPARLADFASQINTFPDAGTDVRPDAVVVSLEEVPDVVDRIEQNPS